MKFSQQEVRRQQRRGKRSKIGQVMVYVDYLIFGLCVYYSWTVCDMFGVEWRRQVGWRRYPYYILPFTFFSVQVIFFVFSWFGKPKRNRRKANLLLSFGFLLGSLLFFWICFSLRGMIEWFVYWTPLTENLRLELFTQYYAPFVMTCLYALIRLVCSFDYYQSYYLEQKKYYVSRVIAIAIGLQGVISIAIDIINTFLE
ncbi:hypothetical protein [uncultured Vagococcus sp.]|uniref:hypothetical protein n=1 Tax=uncultured Vagococcus sp. TaxID=189676 RepID=UPI0028D13BB6|nr:hypothetical protein [uncultured Vagococcus sp.]